MLVSNTSTLVLLAKIGCLEYFLKISPSIEIPSQVQQEALFHEGSYYALLIKKLINEQRIKVVAVEPSKIKPLLAQFRLDEGEAAAYNIFNPTKHKAILTDDGELIKLCKLQEIPFICAMGIVIRLYELKKISRAVALEKLQELHTIGRYSEKLYEHFRKEVQ